MSNCISVGADEGSGALVFKSGLKNPAISFCFYRTMIP